MRKKKDKKTGATTYVYNRHKGATSNLENMQMEIAKQQKVIEDYSKYLDYWKWNYEKAKKEYESRVQKIEDARVMIELLEEHIAKIQSGEEEVIHYNKAGPVTPPEGDDSDE